MLKIKDNVDLKELAEKYNLKRHYFVDEWGYEIEYGKGTYYESLVIWERTRNIHATSCIVLLNLIYDLIKADLVEKVEDKGEK